MGLESIILEEVIKSSVFFDSATKSDAFRLHGHYSRGVGLSLEQHFFCERPEYSGKKRSQFLEKLKEKAKSTRYSRFGSLE